MTNTVLDKAHVAMSAAPDDDTLRLRFHERLADAELFLLLGAEPLGGKVAPQIYALEEGRFALAFDLEERLAEFADGPAPYAALPGRVVARELAAQGVGLGLNLGVAPSSILLPAEALGWLVHTLDQRPDRAEARVAEFRSPRTLPEALMTALDAKLAGLAGLARRAHLAATVDVGGRQGHLLAFEDVLPGAEAALAKAISEALAFSGVEAGALDVTFLNASDRVLVQMKRVALSFDLPEPAAMRADPAPPLAPGMDPQRPPKLR